MRLIECAVECVFLNGLQSVKYTPAEHFWRWHLYLSREFLWKMSCLKLNCFQIKTNSTFSSNNPGNRSNRRNQRSNPNTTPTPRVLKLSGKSPDNWKIFNRKKTNIRVFRWAVVVDRNRKISPYFYRDSVRPEAGAYYKYLIVLFQVF